MLIEKIVNPYCYYLSEPYHEPFHVVRFYQDGVKYLFGYERYEALSVTKMRQEMRYEKPSIDQIEEAMAKLKSSEQSDQLLF